MRDIIFHSYFNYLKSGASLMIAFGIFFILIVALFIISIKTNKLDNYVNNGELIKEEEIVGKIINKKESITLSTHPRFKYFTFIKFKFNKNNQITKIQDHRFKFDKNNKVIKSKNRDMHDYFEKGNDYSFLLKEVRYNNKNYLYIELKDKSACKTKIFVKSREHNAKSLIILSLNIFILSFIICKAIPLFFLIYGII